MKKYYLTSLIACILLLVNSNTVICQSTSTGTATGTANSPLGANDYLGWKSGTNANLIIKNEDNQRIDFLTNTGAGGTTPVVMTITGAGKVGIGLTAPQSLLHQHIASASATYHQFTNSTSGNGSANVGFLVGINSSENAELSMQDNKSILFLTNANRRMKLSGAGDLLIGDYNSFTINNHLVQYSGNNTSTYHQFVTNTSSTGSIDGFRIGVTYNGGANDGELLMGYAGANINFHTNPGGGIVQRMTILSGGNVGINTTGPDRKLDILDGGGDPQMRLTYTDGSVYSDLQTLYTGNLYIHPVTSTGANGDVGISTTTPQARLNVYKNLTSAASEKGEQVDLINSYNGSGVNTGINVTTSITNASEIDGVSASVSGSGSTSNGYIATIANTNTSATQNNGYSAVITDNGTTTVTNNVGFLNNSTTTANQTKNIGFESILQPGAGGSTYCAGYMTGASLTNFDAVNSYGVNVTLKKTNDNYTAGSWYGVNSDIILSGASVGATNSFGGHFSSQGGTSANYGVYASGGSACTSSACIDAAGYFSGDIIYHNQFSTSDANLKDNVQPLINASSLLAQLSPKTFTFKTQIYPSMHLDEGNQYGLIAQDVEQIIPELVRGFKEPEVEDAQGNIVNAEVDFKALNYSQFIPILIAGFQEQQAQIAALTTQLNSCCPSSRTTGSAPANKESIELQDMATLQLLQNDPNPFSESTMIRWNIPNDYANAVIYFYDNSGNQINSYKVNSKGAGELQIFGSKLSQGTYTYSLIVDGKLIDSKKMMRAK